MSDTNTAAPAAATAPVSEAPPIQAEAVSEEVLAEVDAAEEAAEAKDVAVKPKASSKKKYTPKVNGRQKEIEIDIENDEEMLKYLQKALAADEKFEEAASLRKNVEKLIMELKSNPKSVLSHPELGVDLKKFAEEILNEEIQELNKTPEQKELEKLRKELAEKDTRLKAEEEAKRNAEMERLREQSFKQFEDDLTAALDKSTLPKSPYVVKRIADTLIEAVNLGYTDTTVQDILPIVEKQIRGELQNMFEVAPEEVMEELIGKSNLSRLRKSRLAKMKKPVETAKNIMETGNSSKKEEDKKEKKQKFTDLFGRF